MYTKDNRTNLDATHDLHEDFRNVKAKLSETRDAISQTARTAKDKAQDFLQNSIHDVNAKTADIQDNVISYVKGNPIKSVAYAILGGLILAKLLHK